MTSLQVKNQISSVSPEWMSRELQMVEGWQRGSGDSLSLAGDIRVWAGSFTEGIVQTTGVLVVAVLASHLRR